MAPGQQKSNDPAPARTRRRPVISFRIRLAALVLACVVPAWIAAGLLIQHSYQYKRGLTEQYMSDTARSLSLAVDQELGKMQAALMALSTSPALDNGHFAEFHHQARTVLAQYPEGDIILADEGGQQLVNSYVPFGSRLPRRNVPEATRRAVFQQRQPLISDLYRGAVTGRALIGIDVPVVRNDKVIYDLSLTLPAARVAELVAQQQLPSHWGASIIDNNEVFVARSQLADRFVGQRAPWLRARAGTSREGTMTITNVEGAEMYYAFHRSPTTGWTVVVGLPRDAFMAPMWVWLWWTIAGTGLLSLAGVTVAMFIGRSATRIEEQSRSLSDIVESSADAIIGCSLDGIITTWNGGAERLYGYTAEGAIGHSLSLLLPEPQATRLPPLLARLRQGEVVERYGIANQHRDGSMLLIALRMSPVYDSFGRITGASAIARDITGLRQAEAALRDSEERLRLIGDNLPNSVVYQYSHAPDGSPRFLYISAGVERLNGVKPDDVLRDAGTLHRQFLPEQLPGFLQAEAESARTLSVFEREMEMQLPDGQLRWMHLRSRPRHLPDGRVVWDGVQTDITDRKRAEAALIRSEKLAAVGRLAATVAHEINNPLEAVMNLLYLTSTAPDLPPSARQYLDMADAELRRVAHLTRSALGYYRESNAPAMVSVTGILHSSVELLANKVRTRHARVAVNADDDARITAVGGELRQVFSNLLANSLDAIDDGGAVTLRVRRRNGNVHIVVADNGKGVAPAVRSRLFEPFYTTKGTLGTGLGLWVSQQIVAKHGGSLRMRSCCSGAQRGTTMRIVLPAEPRAKSQPAPA